MLYTLIEIGKQMSGEGRHPWEDFLLKEKKERVEGKNYLMLPIIFDLDAGTIRYGDFKTFPSNDPEFRKNHGLIEILKGNNKAIYTGALADQLDKLAKALFGKYDDEKGFPELGEFQESITKETPNLLESEFYRALRLVKPFGAAFYEILSGEKGRLTIKEIEKGGNDILAAVYAAITCNEQGWDEMPLAQLEGFAEYIERKFLALEKGKEGKSDASLCYASGELKKDIGEAEFSARYNLNKIFQGTTVNYAGDFAEGNLRKNYQISGEFRRYLDRGSEKLLNDFKVRICGIDHICIPRLPMGNHHDIDGYRRLKDRADLIFRMTDVKSVLGELKDQAENNLYWLDFYGTESDGNFLKLTSHIRDVSGAHIQAILKEFISISEQLAVYLGNRPVSLGRLYFNIPVRKDLKANHALELCKMILEQRRVMESLLFQYFSELALCIWFERYEGYGNIQKPKGEVKIDTLLRNGVFTYLAFLQILKNLNLLDMEPKNETQAKDAAAQIQAETLQFLDDMGYTPHQRAMFFLGKALRQVVNVQRNEDKSKTALDMVNFNGLDTRSILNLASGIMEKGRQYRAKHKLDYYVGFDLNRFYQYFPGGENAWKMDGKEALFYLLSGYTHFVPKDQPGEDEELLENDSEN